MLLIISIRSNNETFNIMLGRKIGTRMYNNDNDFCVGFKI